MMDLKDLTTMQTPEWWMEEPQLSLSDSFLRTRYSLGMGVVNPKVAFKMTARIADIEPARRRGYIKRLSKLRAYQNMSRRRKTEVRRLLMLVEVTSV